MSEDTLDATLLLIKDLAMREGHSRISVLYHGGEPLSLSAETLFWYSDRVREGLAQFEIQENMQTSLIPLRESHIKFLAERCGSFVGSSIDFTGRTIQDSSDTYIDLWLKKVALAKSHGIEVGPIMVPSKNECTNPEGVYSWFKNNGFDFFNIERYNGYGDGADRPDNKLHSSFLMALFDLAMEDMREGRDFVANNAVAASIAGVLHNMPGERWGGKCQRDFLVINPDGSLNTCPDRIEYEAGQWPKAQDGIDAFQSSPTRRGWIKVQMIEHVENHCKTCEFKSFCKSGCPITDHQVHTGSGECAGYKSHLNHVLAYVSTPEGRQQASAYLTASGMQQFDPYTYGLERIA
tara:strand:+ start:11225 stop:12274 length:1050 start_codon:yes stop_codon:yes gene_type:complete